MKSALLDANILFSAAYADHAPLLRLWRLRGARLCTSAYAIEEARRNLLRNESGLKRLKDLEKDLPLAPEADTRLIPPAVTLRGKDMPILAAAIAAKADYLMTGDRRDFGQFFGKKIAGVLVLRPNDFISLIEPHS